MLKLATGKQMTLGEFIKIGSQPRLFVIGNPARFGIHAFLVDLEHSDYAPSTPANAEFQMTIFPWDLEIAWRDAQ